MEEKTNLHTGFAKTIRCKAHRLGAFFAAAVEESERAAQDRGHLATRTDHAFMGCNPSPPPDMIPSTETPANAVAVPRPIAGDD